MSKGNGVKVISILLGIFICLSLMQAACAKSDKNDKDDNFDNATIPEDEMVFEDYTQHTIDPTYYSTYLLAGGDETFTVSFKNEGDENVNVIPKLAGDPYSEDEIDADWVSISPESAEVSPGSEKDFEITVNVPKDAESGYYQSYIAFTDDILPYTAEDEEPQYVNQMYLSVGVQALPKLEFKSSYISDNLEAGKEYEYLIIMKNVADKDITIDPEVTHDSDIFTLPTIIHIRTRLLVMML